MKAYKHLTNNGQEAVFKLDGKAFYNVELSNEEQSLLEKEALYDKYYILYEWDFESHADNDGGIDAWDFGEKNIPLAPEDSIILKGKVIGFYSCGRVFLIDDGVSYAGGRGSEYIGGWGDVSSSSSYTLKKKEK